MGRNADIVRQGYERFTATGELTPEMLAPDFVWDMSHFDGWPEAQTYDGIEGAQTFLRDWTEAWDDWQLDIESLHESGDRVLVVMHQRGRSKATGLRIEMRFAQLFTVRDGRQTRMEMYSDVTEAMRAAGLPEESSGLA
jgi:ketosteroid isomerase-like protein